MERGSEAAPAGEGRRERGIVYVATGAAFVREALVSARSAKAAMPDLPITLFTDDPAAPEVAGSELWDRVEEIEDPSYSFGDKIPALRRTPYAETLYLDTDTYVAAPCQEVFRPLRDHDVAACYSRDRTEFDFETLPQSCPTLNTGVIVYRASRRTLAFLREWQERYENEFRELHPTDQPAFRDCVYRSDVRLFVLPGEYNVHVQYPSFIGGAADVKILHDHNPYLAEIARVLNGRGHKKPLIYGPLESRMILHWYWMKARKVARRLWREKGPGRWLTR